MEDASLPSASTSSSLLEEVRAHDAEAWRRLTQIYGPAVYGWCRKAGLQPADAADVVQEVFQAVARRIERFRHDAGDSFRAWLWTIYRSKLMDYYRRRQAEPALPGDSALAVMLEAVMFGNVRSSPEMQEEESARLVQRALEVIRGDFQERVWQAFWRSAVLDERTRDVAAALEMTPAAVCMARARVLARLRETLRGMGILPAEGGD